MLYSSFYLSASRTQWALNKCLPVENSRRAPLKDILYNIIREGISQKMTFEWRPEGNEGQVIQISERILKENRKAIAKAL